MELSFPKIFEAAITKAKVKDDLGDMTTYAPGPCSQVEKV